MFFGKVINRESTDDVINNSSVNNIAIIIFSQKELIKINVILEAVCLTHFDLERTPWIYRNVTPKVGNSKALKDIYTVWIHVRGSF